MLKWTNQMRTHGRTHAQTASRLDKVSINITVKENTTLIFNIKILQFKQPGTVTIVILEFNMFDRKVVAKTLLETTEIVTSNQSSFFLAVFPKVSEAAWYMASRIKPCCGAVCGAVFQGLVNGLSKAFAQLRL